jgi:hypothetical protein
MAIPCHTPILWIFRASDMPLCQTYLIAILCATKYYIPLKNMVKGRTDHGRTGRGGHGLCRVSSGPAMPHPSMHRRRAIPKWPYVCFWGGPPAEQAPAGVFYPFGHLTPYAYGTDRSRLATLPPTLHFKRPWISKTDRSIKIKEYRILAQQLKLFYSYLSDIVFEVRISSLCKLFFFVKSCLCMPVRIESIS